MTLPGILLIIIAGVLCIMVVALIPTLMALKRTASTLSSLSDMLQKELRPAIQELTAVLSELKFVGREVAAHTDDVKRFMTALGETGDNLHTINRSVSGVTGALKSTSAWAVGAKVAGRYLIERYLKKWGGK